MAIVFQGAAGSGHRLRRIVWRNVVRLYWPAACLSERADWPAVAFLHISSANERARAERRLRKRPKHVRHLRRLLNSASSIFVEGREVPEEGAGRLGWQNGRLVWCFCSAIFLYFPTEFVSERKPLHKKEKIRINTVEINNNTILVEWEKRIWETDNYFQTVNNPINLHKQSSWLV